MAAVYLPEFRDVAVAVIERGGLYLISCRKEEDSFGGFWEFPGGSAKDGETLEDCIVREMGEELGLRVEVLRMMQVVEHTYPDHRIRLHCFLCGIVSGEPQAIECSEWRWVAAGELSQFKFPPASIALIENLQTFKAAP